MNAEELPAPQMLTRSNVVAARFDLVDVHRKNIKQFAPSPTHNQDIFKLNGKLNTLEFHSASEYEVSVSIDINFNYYDKADIEYNLKLTSLQKPDAVKKAPVIYEAIVYPYAECILSREAPLYFQQNVRLVKEIVDYVKMCKQRTDHFEYVSYKNVVYLGVPTWFYREIQSVLPFDVEFERTMYMGYKQLVCFVDKQKSFHTAHHKFAADFGTQQKDDSCFHSDVQKPEKEINVFSKFEDMEFKSESARATLKFQKRKLDESYESYRKAQRLQHNDESKKMKDRSRWERKKRERDEDYAKNPRRLTGKGVRYRVITGKLNHVREGQRVRFVAEDIENPSNVVVRLSDGEGHWYESIELDSLAAFEEDDIEGFDSADAMTDRDSSDDEA